MPSTDAGPRLRRQLDAHHQLDAKTLEHDSQALEEPANFVGSDRELGSCSLTVVLEIGDNGADYAGSRSYGGE